jgi:hypothetical protein
VQRWQSTSGARFGNRWLIGRRSVPGCVSPRSSGVAAATCAGQLPSGRPQAVKVQGDHQMFRTSANSRARQRSIRADTRDWDELGQQSPQRLGHVRAEPSAPPTHNSIANGTAVAARRRPCAVNRTSTRRRSGPMHRSARPARAGRPRGPHRSASAPARQQGARHGLGQEKLLQCQ